ncbi:MAG: SAM-dependent methyltransferase [Bradymonadia bacterium]|jgi:SAM-dependent methyltransferase
MYFKGLGHEVIGLDGSSVFVEMARKNSGCEVLHQDFLTMDLPASSFDGVFANASLFHVPAQELPRVLTELHDTLRDGGVLFSSNPRGDDREGWSGQRYGSYHSVEAWRRYGVEAGFEEVRQYFRPAGRPQAQQPWSATVWRKETL